MVECGICLEEYKEGDLDLHRKTCVVRLMFRCSLCDEDFVSKEGLWNHLDLHEIEDESKELHYQEIKAKYKFHLCVLCKDQRVYSESPYWKHVQDVHDGFFLQCSDCGENFRSEQLKNDHVVSHCKAKDETVASNLNVLKEEPASVEADHDFEYNSMDDESDVDNSNKNKDLPLKFVCDICGQAFSLKLVLRRHKKKSHEKPIYLCPICGSRYQQKCRLNAHMSLRHGMYSCKLCDLTFETFYTAKQHSKQFHPEESGGSENIQFGHEKNQQQRNDLQRLHSDAKFTEITEQKTCTVASSNPCVASLLLRGKQETQTDLTIVQQDENLEIKLEIDVEEAMLQDQECNDPNENASFLVKHPHGGKSKDIDAEDANDLENGIKVKEEYLEDEEEFVPEHQTTTKSNHEVTISRRYVPVKICSLQEATSFVKCFEFGFAVRSIRNRHERGTSRHYYCLRLKARVQPQCGRRVLILTSKIDNKSTIYVKGEHSCFNAPAENLAHPRQSAVLVDIIQELLKSGISEKDVKKHPKLLGLGVTKRQLNYAVSKVSKQLG